ncbi:carbamoyltransferase HypF [Streptacidiphilus sp. EB129]|uniref:carbamoyltransferase HypF n=1 Tax=Streptacidiphilus sp. EB129 TaxID=3156262 RepID=UPI0035175A8A
MTGDLLQTSEPLEPPESLEPSASATAVRRRFVVRGVVQGVGFRPFVHTLATELGLAGHVTNTGAGVVAEVEGPPARVARFTERLRAEAPPLAWIESVDQEAAPASGARGFAIVATRQGGAGGTLAPADVATCADCLAELADPADRRYRYPFISCTHCGPRFTIIRALPYDRCATTMADFPLCEPCRSEYRDPADRRFHAQPIACHDCGPRHTLVRADGSTAKAEAALAEARRLLAAGSVLAVKGLGGYHLACDAGNADAVALLRRRKARGGKPFALMARSVEDAEALAEVSPAERELLAGRVRPIVLLRRRSLPVPGAPELADGVAPGSPDLGVMLPYTPLHHLLLGLPGEPGGFRLLVLTSGNRSGEPIATDDADARERLAGIADAWLVHDRPIHVPCDDSVVRICDGEPLLLRRSRGYAPLPVTLPVPVPATLAMGGDLKNVVCLAEGTRAWLSGHIGDLEDPATQTALAGAVEQLSAITGVRAETLAADRHPGYHSTRWAKRNADGRRLVGVQHHHAHIASAMAEHGLDADARVIGVAFDGTGYGDDGAVWGGEFLLAGYDGFRRFGQLRYTPLPGGDATVRRPYRMALAHLHAAGLDWDPGLPSAGACPETELRLLRRQLETGLNCVPTSSMGRLFDAVSSLLGICHLADYEARAAVELEAAARPSAGATGYAFGLGPSPWHPAGTGTVTGTGRGADLLADPGPVLAAALAEARSGVPVGLIAARFHTAVADLVVRVCEAARERVGPRPVVLSGGVFANTVLAVGCAAGLRAAGFTVLRHRQVPPNDGGLALGQVLVAARTDPG